jgi:hypothetical protein
MGEWPASAALRRPAGFGGGGERLLAGAGANIVSLDQHFTEQSGGTFMQRTIFHLPGLTAALSCVPLARRALLCRTCVVLNDNIYCAWIAGVTPHRWPREVIEASLPVLWESAR